MYRANEEIRAYTTQETVFGVLKKLMIIRRIGRYQRQERGIRFLEAVVTSWKNYTRKKKVIKYWQSKRNSDRMYSAFVCWSHYRDIRQNKGSIRERIQGFYNKKLLKRGIEGFKKTFELFRLEAKVEKRLEEFAANYFDKRVLKLGFAYWREYAAEVLVPKRLKNQIAEGKKFCLLKWTNLFV